jgi:hypothetical protein
LPSTTNKNENGNFGSANGLTCQKASCTALSNLKTVAKIPQVAENPIRLKYENSPIA